MRTLARIGVLAVIVAGLSSPAASTAAMPARLRELPVSQLQTSAGELRSLHSGVTYQASRFPLALRLTPPDGSWAGAQWESGRLPAEQVERLGIRDQGGPPHFGWAAVGHAGSTPAGFPRGLIVIMTAYARTPSLAATVHGLRTRGHGATYDESVPVELAGLSGVQFDGQRNPAVTHIFVPFSSISHGGGAFPSARDAFEVFGTVFRIIVLNPRGKTIVVCIDPVALPTDQFPAFLAKADQILKTLRFPR